MTSVADYYLKLIREQYTKPKTIKSPPRPTHKPISDLPDEQTEMLMGALGAATERIILAKEYDEINA